MKKSEYENEDEDEDDWRARGIDERRKRGLKAPPYAER
jgi:hypothetical protein